MKRPLIIIAIFLTAGIVILQLFRPRQEECRYQTYFLQLNEALKRTQGGESAGIIDLDRLDNNISIIRFKLGDDFKLRIVAKSLPCFQLLDYLMDKGETNRLMVFSEPFIAQILKNYNVDSLDVLLGKPLPVDALSRLSENDGWENINWLIDTRERLQEYLDFAQRSQTLINISLEIDVGLHRGGFETMESFSEAIEVIQTNSQYLNLTGLMGYDGHVSFVPFYINRSRAISKAFNKVQVRYSEFVDELKKYYPSEFVGNLTFNGGGSRTYFYYPDVKEVSPVNDIALGSGFVSPEQFPELEAIGHQPALYLCSPVLKRMEVSELPNAERLSPIVNWWNPNLKVTYFTLGGGWPGELVSPGGIRSNPFWSENDKGYSNLLPNQSTFSSSDKTDLEVGDFIFTQPWEGDGMLTFSRLTLYKHGAVTGHWETYHGGN